jgi:hypothetical protein
MRTLLLLLLLATSMSAKANEDYFSGYQLLKFCELQDKQLCYGYMLGFIGGWDVARMQLERPRCRFINSPDTTTGQMALVFIKWAKENPERLHEHAGVGFRDDLKTLHRGRYVTLATFHPQSCRRSSQPTR